MISMPERYKARPAAERDLDAVVGMIDWADRALDAVGRFAMVSLYRCRARRLAPRRVALIGLAARGVDGSEG